MLDECIDTMSNIRLTFHRPLLNDDKPVLKADKPWECNANGDPYAAPFSGGVWYDEQDHYTRCGIQPAAVKNMAS